MHGKRTLPDSPVLFVHDESMAALRPELDELSRPRIDWAPLSAGAATGWHPLVLIAVEPDGDGLTLLQRCVRRGLRTVVAVSDVDGASTAAAMEAGAIAVWNRLLDPRLFPHLVSRLLRAEHTDRLRHDELRLLALLGTGRPVSALATELFTSERTLYRSLRALYRKLGVCNRWQAADYYRTCVKAELKAPQSPKSSS